MTADVHFVQLFEVSPRGASIANNELLAHVNPVLLATEKQFPLALFFDLTGASLQFQRNQGLHGFHAPVVLAQLVQDGLGFSIAGGNTACPRCFFGGLGFFLSLCCFSRSKHRHSAGQKQQTNEFSGHGLRFDFKGL